MSDKYDAPPGIWRVVAFGSGSVIVSDGKERATKYGVALVGPHIGILYAPLGGDANRSDALVFAERQAAAVLIADILNGRSTNRDGLRRIDEITGVVATGQHFVATGPCIDRDPPNCFWEQDNSDAAKSGRARLMDRVFGISATKKETSDE